MKETAKRDGREDQRSSLDRPSVVDMLLTNGRKDRNEGHGRG